jgi:hypothetical protein
MNIKLLKAFIQRSPVDEVEIRTAVQQLLDENQAMKAALLTGRDSKRKYAGKIEETLNLDAVCRCGDIVHFNQDRKLPWSMIESVLKLAQKNAGI